MFQFTLSDNYKSALEEKIHRILSFMTSADVVMKASGLRIDAIKVIAHEQDIEIDDMESRCIDENLLSKLADAHVRQLKFYFNNSKRHSSELSGAELSAFVDFCQTFKKHYSTTVDSWDDIDTDAIQEQFYRKVHKLTPHRELLELFAGAMHIEASPLPLRREFTLEEFESKYIEQQQDDVMSRVLKSRWLYTRLHSCHSYYEDVRLDIRRTTLSGRYYVFPDEEDHQSDTFNFIGNNNLNINSIPKMVA